MNVSSSLTPLLVFFQYGHGQWLAVKNAVRRHPAFRFDYFLRSLPVDLLGRRCEQLMKAAEKEIEQLERNARGAAGLPTEPESAGGTLPPIELLSFRVLQEQRRLGQQTKAEKERRELEAKVSEIESQIQAFQKRLKELNEGALAVRVTPSIDENSPINDKNHGPDTVMECDTMADNVVAELMDSESANGAVGPDGTFVAFPSYDGSGPPAEWKKAFTQYCNRERKSVKASLNPDDRIDKVRSVLQIISMGSFLELTAGWNLPVLFAEETTKAIEARMDRVAR